MNQMSLIFCRLGSYSLSDLSWDHAEPVWNGERPRAAGHGEDGRPNENSHSQQLDKGKKWPKSGPKMDARGIFPFWGLEDRNLLRLRSLDSFCPFS